MSKKEFLAQYGKFDPNKIGKDDTDYYIGKNPGIDHKSAEKIAHNYSNWDGQLGLSLNPSTPTHVLRILTKHSDVEIQSNALLHKNVDPNDIDKAISDKRTHPSVVSALVSMSPHLTKDQLHKIAYPKQGEYGHTDYIKDKAFDRIRDGKYSDGQ